MVVITSNYNHPNDYKAELIDHINISLDSVTPIGRLMSPEFNRVVFYPQFGRFASVYSLWMWLRDKNHSDTLRTLKPENIRKYFQNPEKQNTVYVKNFKAIIATATWMKFKNQNKVLEQIKLLPDNIHFLFYTYVKNTNLRVTGSLPPWMIVVADEIVSAVKENREPNFMFLVSHPDEIRTSYTEGAFKEICPHVV